MTSTAYGLESETGFNVQNVSLCSHTTVSGLDARPILSCFLSCKVVTKSLVGSIESLALFTFQARVVSRIIFGSWLDGRFILGLGFFWIR